MSRKKIHTIRVYPKMWAPIAGKGILSKEKFLDPKTATRKSQIEHAHDTRTGKTCHGCDRAPLAQQKAKRPDAAQDILRSLSRSESLIRPKHQVSMLFEALESRFKFRCRRTYEGRR